MEEVIRKYFQCWLDKDITVVEEIFSDNIIYSECYGPVYKGIGQVIRWFEEWNRKGTVLQWNIKRVIVSENTVVVEWYFRCNYDSNVDGCVQVVEYFYNCHFDRDALDFSRFTVHLRFFAQRVFQGKQEQENDTHDEVFRALIARNCSEHYKCACCIAEYVRNTWHKELSDEELVFLTIHLKRIRMGK